MIQDVNVGRGLLLMCQAVLEVDRTPVDLVAGAGVWEACQWKASGIAAPSSVEMKE